MIQIILHADMLCVDGLIHFYSYSLLPIIGLIHISAGAVIHSASRFVIELTS